MGRVEELRAQREAQFEASRKVGDGSRPAVLTARKAPSPKPAASMVGEEDVACAIAREIVAAVRSGAGASEVAGMVRAAAGRLGGEARAAKLSAVRRVEIARKAARARWGS